MIRIIGKSQISAIAPNITNTPNVELSILFVFQIPVSVKIILLEKFDLKFNK
jgi:hypothetical protein